MKRFKVFLIFALTVTILQSCASAPAVQDTAEEMGLLSPVNATSKYYSRAEISKWKVLVLDSGNTERTAKFANEMSAKWSKGMNRTLGADFNFTRITSYQDSMLRGVFGNVSYEGREGEHYDLIILRDYSITLGLISGSQTVTNLSYYFIVPVVPEDVGGDYIVRGKLDVHGIGIIPYPAQNYALQDSNRNCVDNMAVMLSGGLTLYQVAGDKSVPFVGTAKKSASKKVEEHDVPIEEEKNEVSIPSNLLKQKLEILKTAE